MKRIPVLLIAVLMSTLLLPQVAFAYSTTGKYMTNSLWYYPSEVFAENTKQNIRDGMAEWNLYLPSSRRLCFSWTTHSCTSFPSDDLSGIMAIYGTVSPSSVSARLPLVRYAGARSTSVTSEGKLTQYHESVVAELALDELEEASELILEGVVSDISEPFLVQPSDGSDARFFVDVTVLPNRLLFGEATDAETGEVLPNEQIVVRVPGGAGELLAYVDDNAPQLQVGESYLLFLGRCYNGADYATAGNQYSGVAGAQSAWRKLGDYYACESMSRALRCDEMASDIECFALTHSFRDQVANRKDWLSAYRDMLDQEVAQGVVTALGAQREYADLALNAAAPARVMSQDEASAYEHEFASRMKAQHGLATEPE